MTDLFTHDKARVMKKRFIGKRITLERVLNRPIEIIDFEISTSQCTGKELLYLQLKYYNQPRFFWTEGVLLIKTIKSANRVELPFRTKIVQGKDNYLRFAKVE
ncbi:MAG: hypothetical protein AB2L24_21935 [Mangrovibacterium sp.]